MANEEDKNLRVEPDGGGAATEMAIAKTNSRTRRLKAWYTGHKRLSIPLSIVLFIFVLAALPPVRYGLAGLLLKKNFSVQILDSATSSVVSGALVSAGSVSAQTDGSGKAVLKHLKVGSHTISISKKYYTGLNASAVVPIFSQKNPLSIKLQATGRQTKVTVKNLVGQGLLSNVAIKVADISAKTDKNGQAIIVLPVGTTSKKATLDLEGYNEASVTIKASDTKIEENVFSLTPAGQVYFLSKRNGTLDLMKSNLDGSGAKVVQAGTGNEHDYDTLTMSSADHKYIALVAKRSGGDPTPQLYIVSTASDSLQSIATGNATFSPRGWSGNVLIYSISRNDIATGQANKYQLKSYDAGSGKTTLLDQSGSSTNGSTTAYEYYNFITVGSGKVVFAKSWSLVNYGGALTGLQNSLGSVDPDGKNHMTLANYDATQGTVQLTQHSATSIYIWQQASSPGSDKFYDYTIGNSAPKQASIDSDKFYQLYPTYYLSSSGKQTFWSEIRDGKNTLFVGDSLGNNAATIATASDYAPYSWFSDQYLLVAKNNSELYVMSVKGGTPAKVTDYQSTSTPTAY